ncbi:DNA helicase IV [Sanguibacter gelidistatuariae]|uniref:DNA helicase IV n=1 Tax=Sanguibacter gelidistatuariae TaxID=1814289 RepID=A0A1G6NWE8_9MICO|nr:AAA family ATPase [Sanguibacter gelidistatuariae]SDC71961.1 DNA helicase IV [Sanguibacter gelidistatuariae]
MADQSDEIQVEQQTLDVLYARLDELRAATRARLGAVRRGGPSGSPQNRSERDAFATLYEDRAALLEAVEDRLCFGRLDFDDQVTRYIGRIGLTDEQHTSILTDWRAPAAQSFYRATAAHRDGVFRRRHLVTTGRQVTGLEDEILDLTLPGSHVSELNLSGEGALLAALAAGRTGRMGDIVATIQSEQDAIIRSDLQGALVVQGGPGTGKTAVALHRAAYLLYAHRRLLERSGVLLIGPSQSFLRYIDQVLPSLGETGVVSTTISDLIPGFSARATESPVVAEIKGRAVFGSIIRRAVTARQRVPAQDVRLRVDGHDIVIRRRDIRDAIAKARRNHKPHNQARVTFVREMLSRLAQQYVDQMSFSIEKDERAEVIEELRTTREIRIALNLAWMPLTPEKLVADLFAKPHRLAQVAHELSPAEQAALARPAGSPWTESDVPLLDEAAELLGEDNQVAKAQARQDAEQRAHTLDYARQVLESSDSGGGLVNADMLADRFATGASFLTTAERAEKDRAWTYAHLVVDEAQELSAMAWRALIRRCPSRSMTIVGDVAQTSSPAGARSWSAMLTPLLRDAWRMSELTVNYRTPEAVATAARTMALTARLPVSPLTSAREIPGALQIHPAAAADLRALTLDLALRTVGEVRSGGAGQVAVVVPAGQTDAVRSGLLALALARGEDPADLADGVVVLSPAQVKGLEFDAVVLEEPADIYTGPGGASDLYVAMTRPTKYLHVTHSRPLPPGMSA